MTTPTEEAHQEITGVKILSSDTVNYSYDKTYTKAGAGTMIAIMGKNLSSALHVYINDQEVTINPTMNTDHSIIVTIPTEAKGFKLSAFDSNIPDEIKVETTHGTATYAFKVTAPGPQLQRIEAKYPRSAGDTLKLHGLNLVDVEKIFITDVQAAALDTTTLRPENIPGNHTDVTDFFSISQDHRYNAATQSYTTYSLEGAIMPANAPDSGALVIQCAAGTTYMPYYRVPGKPVVLSVSNDMPQIGETLVITGREFIQVSSITYGDVTLTPDEFTVSASQDSIYVPFTKQPSGNVSTLTVTTPGGQANVERFYDRSTILTTFDNDDAVDRRMGTKRFIHRCRQRRRKIRQHICRQRIPTVVGYDDLLQERTGTAITSRSPTISRPTQVPTTSISHSMSTTQATITMVHSGDSYVTHSGRTAQQDRKLSGRLPV